uniref:T-complex protein 1 subunit theta n=1 Tax=Branchiostoma floridae TaxID=7739 RepID=C3ZLF0_BRAFL|eukprot:XP_002590576.1 hypothetical protein BRAFLDRAFT_114782 [Branchiostoma floridae]
MAMRVPKAPGLAQMLKDGSKTYHGLEEAVYRNIDACRELAKTTRTAYGPNGKVMKQSPGNRTQVLQLTCTNSSPKPLGQKVLTSWTGQLVVLEPHCYTRFQKYFSASFLASTRPCYGDLVCGEVKDLRKSEEVFKVIRTAVASKQYGNEDFLSNLITKACIMVHPKKSAFNVDSVRVCKMLGCGVYQSTVIQGMVFKREAESDLVKAKDAKIVVYTCPFDMGNTETKGTVLIKTAKELMDFSKGEEGLMDAMVKSIADTGAKVVVSGGKVADMALHYANKYGLMVVRLNSKFDLRRLCKAVGATALPRLTQPTAEELGHCDMVYSDEIGEDKVVVFKQEKEESALATIVIRGSTENIMDDIERAIDDGVNNFKVITRDQRLLPGAGATEIELARQLASYAETCPGLEQYAIMKYAEAFESLVKALAENCGIKSQELIANLYAEHQQGRKNVGFDNEGEGVAVKDVAEANILEPFLTKMWGIRLASNAAATVLKVDQIIMSKPAGGPKPREKADWDDDD